MKIDKLTRKKWRRLAHKGMNSALGEYTPVEEFIALLDYIDELEEQSLTLIPVEDRLPGKGITVLVYSNSFSGYFLSFFDGSGKFTHILYRELDVTHWMPLPKEPK